MRTCFDGKNKQNEWTFYFCFVFILFKKEFFRIKIPRQFQILICPECWKKCYRFCWKRCVFRKKDERKELPIGRFFSWQHLFVLQTLYQNKKQKIKISRSSLTHMDTCFFFYKVEFWFCSNLSNRKTNKKKSMSVK